MPRAKKSEDQPWLRYVVLPILLILFGLEASYLYLSRVKAPPAPESPTITSTPTPTPTPTPPPYSCLEGGWVSCMPMPSPQGPKNFTPEALAWFKNNCPNFEGIAY